MLPGIKIAQGGMFRCCIETAVKLSEELDEWPREGDTFDCIHEPAGNKQIIYKDGAFRWNSEKA